ncbi:MAG: hypothetical protein ACRC2J_20190 [Microcoleaceae cyanobacterium]
MDERTRNILKNCHRAFLPSSVFFHCLRDGRLIQVIQKPAVQKSRWRSPKSVSHF